MRKRDMADQLISSETTDSAMTKGRDKARSSCVSASRYFSRKREKQTYSARVHAVTSHTRTSEIIGHVRKLACDRGGSHFLAAGARFAKRRDCLIPFITEARWSPVWREDAAFAHAWRCRHHSRHTRTRHCVLRPQDFTPSHPTTYLHTTRGDPSRFHRSICEVRLRDTKRGGCVAAVRWEI